MGWSGCRRRDKEAKGEDIIKMMLLTLDSSIFVAALRGSEERHKECKALLNMIVEREYVAVEPYSVLVEVVSAAKRRTGSEEFAKEVQRSLLRSPPFTS